MSRQPRHIQLPAATAGGRRVPACARATTAEADLLDPALARRLADAARARDLYVHHYWAIDAARVFDELHARVADLGAMAVWTAARLARVLPPASGGPA